MAIKTPVHRSLREVDFLRTVAPGTPGIAASRIKHFLPITMTDITFYIHLSMDAGLPGLVYLGSYHRMAFGAALAEVHLRMLV